MPDIPDRTARENRFSRLIRAATAPLRARLITALGSPPDVANIPASLWDEVEESIEKQAAVALALMFLAGTAGMIGQFGDATAGFAPDEDVSTRRAEKWSTKRAGKLARGMVDTMRDRLKTRADEVRERLGRIEAEREAAREAGTTPRPEPRKPSPGESPGTRGRRIDFEPSEEVPRIPTRKEIDAEIEADLKGIQEQQASDAGVTETTGANTAGEKHFAGEVKKRGGLMTATWRTEGDDRVCPICKPLNWMDEKDWPAEQENGPPGHVNCRCFLTWHLVTWEGEPSEN